MSRHDSLDPSERSEVFEDLYPEFNQYKKKIKRRRNNNSSSDGKPKGLMIAAGVGAFFAVRAALRKIYEKDIAGKVVVITGGGRGLGLTLARQLAAQGARLALCARDPQELDRARAELEAQGAEVLVMPCDITQVEQVNEFIRVVQDRFQTIDVLINNAGIIQVAPLDEMTLADFERTMNTNFYGALHMTLAVLPQMKRRKSGAIVNISSFGGKISIPHMLPYSASKHALTGFTEGLRAEVAKYNISVTGVYPGTLRTGSHVNAEFKGQNEKEAEWFTRGATTPGISMNAERAAAQIITGFKQQRAQVVMPLSTEIAVKVHGLLPAVTQTILTFADAALPTPGGIGKQIATGKESGALTADTEKMLGGRSAAAQNNEM